MKKSYFIVSVFVLLLFNGDGFGQEKTEKEPALFSNLNKAKMFSPIVSVETWATYSHGAKTSDGADYAGQPNLMFRRVRFGGKGHPYSWLGYQVELNLDRLGQSDYSSVKGSYGGLDVWKAFFTAKLLAKSDLLYLHAGYYWAAVSREFNTSPWAVGSLDKSRADWYLRKFMTGKGNGIESGFGLGGLKNYDNFGINYRAGVYFPKAYSSAEYSSVLYTGRLMLSLGDPEQTSYSYTLSGNQWGKRNGVTLGFGGSAMSQSEVGDLLYKDSYTYGADILINLGGLRIDGEYFKMKRKSGGYADYDGDEWHIRAGYDFVIDHTFLEPVIHYEKYKGEGAKEIFSKIGDDKTLDIGVNWYIHKDKLMFGAHYVDQNGSISSDLGSYGALAFQFRL